MAYLSIRDGRTESQGHKGRKLSDKMLSFIDAYFGAAGLNAVKAYELSAYKKTSDHNTRVMAAELMNHPLVRAEVDRRAALRQEKSEIKAEYLLNKLIAIIDDAQSEKTADRLRAIELAGKAIALWKERQEISGPDGEAIRHEQNIKESVADFTGRISGLAKRAGTDNVVSFPERSGTGGT